MCVAVEIIGQVDLLAAQIFWLRRSSPAQTLVLCDVLFLALGVLGSVSRRAFRSTRLSILFLLAARRSFGDPGAIRAWTLHGGSGAENQGVEGS